VQDFAQKPDLLAALRKMQSNSVVSRHTQRAYLRAFDDLFTMAGARPITRMLLMEYRAAMIAEGLSVATVNQRLCAIRKLVNEARENGLIDPAEAVRLTSVPGVPQTGVRLGNWLTLEETQALLAAVDRTELIGKRNFAILSVLGHCGLRREETAKLDTSLIQLREGRWVIADLIGKRGRVRTVPIPTATKVALDVWTGAAGVWRVGRFPSTCLPEEHRVDQIHVHEIPPVAMLERIRAAKLNDLSVNESIMNAFNVASLHFDFPASR
jgi:integrase